MNAVANRYMILRTFPAGALDGVNAQVKKMVNDNNSDLGVTWIHSYANADKTRTPTPRHVHARRRRSDRVAPDDGLRAPPRSRSTTRFSSSS